ncbi:MAG: hypothetical protein HFF09_02535 [Oscillospiraceae bacterium]|nr:hypothetical protein [Oscillospiraceae bacterium]
MNRWTLPEKAKINGRLYAIHADFRDVLDILTRLNKEEADAQTRLYVALALFYEGFEAMPERDYQEAAVWLMTFLNGGEEDKGKPGPKLLDWEQDAGLIVSGVNKVAGREVRAMPFCHWWTFLGWFSAVGEGSLATVIGIRDKRRRGKKLLDWEQEYYREHREQVDFQKHYTDEEVEERKRLLALLDGDGSETIR